MCSKELGQRTTVAKVPSDAGEALRSSLMGIFEKRRMKSFIEWVGTFTEADSANHKGNMHYFCVIVNLTRVRSQHQPMHDEGRI